MSLWTSLFGTVKCKVVHADILRLMTKIGLELPIENLAFTADLTAVIDVARKDYRKLAKLVKSAGGQVQILQNTGIYWSLKRLLQRPVLVVGVFLLLLLVLYLPTRILFISVDGNSVLTDHQILQKAEAAGITFGVSRSRVRNEQVKSVLLESLPQLQWACINTKGCTAVISVEERLQSESNRQHPGAVVAIRDGIITSMSVLEGVVQCQVGEAVKKGQVLISDVADYGLLMKYTGAEGEIYGETAHQISVVTPRIFQECTAADNKRMNYAVLVGKNLINFRKYSGISPAECVRMYETKYITLPGGFQLPLAIVKETLYTREVYTVEDAQIENCVWLDKAATEYLQSDMVAGSILSSMTMKISGNGVFMLYGEYRCNEMIGSVRKEELFLNYGKRD